MNENILERMSFEHSLRHSYLLIPQEAFHLQSYEAKLLRETQVPGALPMGIRPNAENSTLSILEYELSGLESMAGYFSSRKLRYLSLACLMENIHALLEHLEEFLLPEDMVLLDPSAIFYDPEKNSWSFTLVPGYRSLFHESLKALIAWLLKRIDYSEDRVVVMAYPLYHESLKEFLVMENLLRICRQNIERERLLQLERNGNRTALQNAASLPTDSHASIQTSASSIASDCTRDTYGMRPRMVSTDGIFRPIDAGLSELPDSISDTQATLNQPPINSSESIAFPSDYGEDEYSKTVKALNERTQDYPVNTYPGHTAPCTNYTGFENHDLDEVSVSELSAPVKTRSTFPRFHRRKNGDSRENEKQIKKSVENSTLKEALSTEQSHGSFKAKTFLSVALMILIPFLIWFLKGGLVLRRMFPLIFALECGILVVIVLDYLMAKLPDD